MAGTLENGGGGVVWFTSMDTQSLGWTPAEALPFGALLATHCYLLSQLLWLQTPEEWHPHSPHTQVLVSCTHWGDGANLSPCMLCFQAAVPFTAYTGCTEVYPLLSVRGEETPERPASQHCLPCYFLLQQKALQRMRPLYPLLPPQRR